VARNYDKSTEKEEELSVVSTVAVQKWRKIRRDTVSSSSSWPPNNEPGQLRVALRIEIAYLSAAYVIVDWRQLLARHLVQTRAGTFGMFRLA
jgi:hypothetical protein